MVQDLQAHAHVVSAQRVIEEQGAPVLALGQVVGTAAFVSWSQVRRSLGRKRVDGGDTPVVRAHRHEHPGRESNGVQAPQPLRGSGLRREVECCDLGNGQEAVAGQVVERLVTTAGSVARLYALATTPEDRKALLRHVFARIVVRDRTIADIEYNPPFDLLLGDKPAAGSGIPLERALLDYISARKVA